MANLFCLFVCLFCYFFPITVGVGNNNEGILVLGATNIPWTLDSAIRRRQGISTFKQKYSFVALTISSDITFQEQLVDQ